MRRSVTEVMKNRGYGCILGEDGCEFYFDENSLDSVDIRHFRLGDGVEYQEQYWEARVRAVKIRPIVGPRIRAANHP